MAYCFHADVAALHRGQLYFLSDCMGLSHVHRLFGHWCYDREELKRGFGRLLFVVAGLVPSGYHDAKPITLQPSSKHYYDVK